MKTWVMSCARFMMGQGGVLFFEFFLELAEFFADGVAGGGFWLCGAFAFDAAEFDKVRVFLCAFCELAQGFEFFFLCAFFRGGLTYAFGVGTCSCFFAHALCFVLFLSCVCRVEFCLVLAVSIIAGDCDAGAQRE